FAESAACRHRQICLHFGETPKWESCGMCDVCSAEPEWLAKDAEDEPARRKGGKAMAAAAPPDAPPRPRSPSPIPAPAPFGPGVDPALREYMREWRRGVAQRQGVPAFIVLHDTSLEDLCRRRPVSLAELLQVSGIGERKAELYGQQIFAAMERFSAGARASAVAEKKISPAEETMRLLAEGRSFQGIAQLRERQL